LRDLDKIDPQPYKLVIFLNAYNLDDSQRALIKSHLLNSGRVVLWCYAPGFFNGVNSSAANVKDICGIHVDLTGSDETLRAPRIQIKPQYHPLGQILADTGHLTFGPTQAVCKLPVVADSEATILGSSPGTNNTMMAISNRADWGGGDWISIYSVTSEMPAAIYREIARYAGVHIYNEKDDAFYANRSLVSLHANGAGSRTIRFTKTGNIFDMMTGAKLAGDVDQYTQDFANGETVVISQPIDHLPQPSTRNNLADSWFWYR